MIRSILHRGPDGTGLWVDPEGHAALGHARLAIIDLSDEGKQPMISHDRNLVLSLNGEIYNYLELRSALEREGSRFRGMSDTEVFLEAVARWGIERALSSARGMFAFALWDCAQRLLWLSRDPVGKKPLYFFEDGGELVFSSEIKAIRNLPGISLSLSPQSLSDYLTLGYVPGPRTIYRGVLEVRPGTALGISMDARPPVEIEFWRFPNRAPNQLSPGQLKEEARRLLCDSIRLRLRADVPVGVYLSGGIDSGLITALAAQQSSKPIETFTVTFGSAAFDESDMARLVAERYGTRHHEFRLDPDLEDLLPKVVRAYDEPFADPSALPSFAVSEAAAEHVKVVLNGEGADELFGGYRRTYAMRWLERVGPMLSLLPKSVFDGFVNALPQPRGFRTRYAFLHRFARAVTADRDSRYVMWSSDGFTEEEKLRLGCGESEPSLIPTPRILQDRMEGYESLGPLACFMAQDFLIGMTDCLLPKIDIATMAHGLEGRSPFLDHVLVEWVSQLDKRSLLSGRNTKPVLRQIAQDLLPTELVSAPKRGFEIPLVQWMKRDLKSMVRDVCTAENGLLFDLFDKREVRALLERRVPMDDARWARRTWILFMLASWGDQCRS